MEEEIWIPKWAPSIVHDEVPDFDWDLFLTHDEWTQRGELEGWLSVGWPDPRLAEPLSAYWQDYISNHLNQLNVKEHWHKLTFWQKIRYFLGLEVVIEVDEETT